MYVSVSHPSLHKYRHVFQARIKDQNNQVMTWNDTINLWNVSNPCWFHHYIVRVLSARLATRAVILVARCYKERNGISVLDEGCNWQETVITPCKWWWGAKWYIDWLTKSWVKVDRIHIETINTLERAYVVVLPRLILLYWPIKYV